MRVVSDIALLTYDAELQLHRVSSSISSGISNLASKLDQIGAKWDKSGTFYDGF